MPADAKPIRVLLTGGPGGGKTSALATLRDRLTRRGVQALLVPETASALLGNSGGYDLSWVGTPKIVTLQEIIMKYQMFQENTYIDMAALRPEKPAVVICDRGLLEGKLFCTDEEWAESLRRLNTTEEELLRRYDVVIHLKSLASGMEHLYDYGPGSSNPSRFHTPEQARETDLKAQELFKKHPQVRIVNNFPDLASKIETVLEYVFETLQFSGTGAIGEWDREFVAANLPLKDVWPVKREVFETKVSFLDASFSESIRCKARIPVDDGDSKTKLDPELDVSTVQYEHRKEVKQGDRSCWTRQLMHAEAYNLLHERSGGSAMSEVRKRSTCFIWEGRHYELSTYIGVDGNPLGEEWGFHGYRVLDKPVGAPVPTFLVSGSGKRRRELARHATTDAALSLGKSSRPAVPVFDTIPSPKRRCIRGEVEANTGDDEAKPKAPTVLLEEMLLSPTKGQLSQRAAQAVHPSPQPAAHTPKELSLA